MHRLGTAVLVFALASGTVWAQTSDEGGARKSGVQSAPGVVTGGDSQSGISLRSDSGRGNASVPA